MADARYVDKQFICLAHEGGPDLSVTNDAKLRGIPRDDPVRLHVMADDPTIRERVQSCIALQQQTDVVTSVPLGRSQQRLAVVSMWCLLPFTPTRATLLMIMSIKCVTFSVHRLREYSSWPAARVTWPYRIKCSKQSAHNIATRSF